MQKLNDKDLKLMEVRILDILTLVQKNVKILEGPDRTWGQILDKTAKDFNIIHGTDLNQDDLYQILNSMNVFDHSKKPTS